MKLDSGILKFKLNPNKGLQWLVSEGLLEYTPEAVTDFLHANMKTLDKVAVGEYVGGYKEFNQKVLRAYVDRIDFTAMTFDEAIRHFLSHFRLPGEAQIIDRIMLNFASKYGFVCLLLLLKSVSISISFLFFRYCACNPTVFSNADTAYILAYSVIMLNTDAHKFVSLCISFDLVLKFLFLLCSFFSPMVKRKMTKDGFLRNNRGIDNGQDINRAFLEFVSFVIRCSSLFVVLFNSCFFFSFFAEIFTTASF
jgi:brefeldin A-inhibited guanine nucleotide-exchange protein